MLKVNALETGALSAEFRGGSFCTLAIFYNSTATAKAMHLKLDELLRAIKGAHTEMINLKNLSDEELEKLEQAFNRLARYAGTHAHDRGCHGRGLAPGARYDLHRGHRRRAMIKVS